MDKSQARHKTIQNTNDAKNATVPAKPNLTGACLKGRLEFTFLFAKFQPSKGDVGLHCNPFSPI